MSDEEWEDVDVLEIAEESPKITDQERVYLVGVQVKSRKTDAESFTGVAPLSKFSGTHDGPTPRSRPMMPSTIHLTNAQIPSPV